MKKWKINFEVNMNASHTESMIIKANTKRKALKFLEEKCKKRDDIVCIDIISINKAADPAPISKGYKNDIVCTDIISINNIHDV